MKSLLQDLEEFLESLQSRARSSAERMMIESHLNKVRDELARMEG